MSTGEPTAPPEWATYLPGRQSGAAELSGTAERVREGEQ